MRLSGWKHLLTFALPFTKYRSSWTAEEYERYTHTCAPWTWVCQNQQGWGKEILSPSVFYLALHAVGLPSLPSKRPYISINVRQDRPRAGTARVSRPRTVIRSEGFSFLKNWSLTWNMLFLDADVSGIFLFFLKVSVEKPTILCFSDISVARAAEATKIFVINRKWAAEFTHLHPYLLGIPSTACELLLWWSKIKALHQVQFVILPHLQTKIKALCSSQIQRNK